MDSPILSRPPSSIFSPGPHRRSHPNLHHLSLAPLTPKYPIDPSDYDAYFDPETSTLHTSASLSNVASLPGPRGILTNSPARSRATSKTRLKRKTKSTVSIQAPEDLPHGALTSEGFGVKESKRISVKVHRDPSWLVQTGLALTEGSRESKGQLWIVKRQSSTSLITHEPEQRSGRTTPSISRKPSRTRKREVTTDLKILSPEPDFRPDWADTQTQAEIAAELDREMREELEAESDDELTQDRYGMVDFEGQFDTDDEEDVREAVRHGFRLGKWIDGVVDVLLQLEEDEEPDLEAGQSSVSQIKASVLPPEKPDAGEVSDDSMDAPPERPQRLWDDVSWFGRLLVRNLRS